MSVSFVYTVMDIGMFTCTEGVYHGIACAWLFLAIWNSRSSAWKVVLEALFLCFGGRLLWLWVVQTSLVARTVQCLAITLSKFKDMESSYASQIKGKLIGVLSSQEKIIELGM